MAKTEEKQKKKSKKKTERYFYQKWWFWVAISSILCCANLAYAIWGCKTDNKSDILTAISGWISGVATLAVGIIAYKQSEKYKKENDYAIEEQYNFEAAKLLIESRTYFISDIKDKLNLFVKKYDCNLLRFKLSEIQSLRNPTFTSIEQNHLEREVEYFLNDIQAKGTQICTFLQNDVVQSSQKQKLEDALQILIDEYSKYEKINLQMVNAYILPKHNNLLDAISDYLIFLDKDLESILIKDIRDVPFIKQHYSRLKEKEQEKND